MDEEHRRPVRADARLAEHAGALGFELGLPVQERRAPRPVGNSNEGKPGTRKTRYGKETRFKSGAGRR